MAAIDPKGDEKYWKDGLPFQGVRLQRTKAGVEKFWRDGLPARFLTPPNNEDAGKQFFFFF